MPKKKQKVQYRYYDLPPDSPILALLGHSWIRPYGDDLDLMHFHNLLEIGYCYEGTGTLILGDAAHAYHPQAFSIIPANYLHNTRAELGTKSQWEYLFLHPAQFLIKHFHYTPERAQQLAQRVNLGALFFRHDQQPEIADLILQIMEEYRAQSTFYIDSASGLLLSLLTRLARLRPEQPAEPLEGGHLHLSIQSALDYVRKNYQAPVRISAMAEACHMSETHFRRLFRQYMHMPPLSYVNLIRIEAARKLLRGTALPIKDIALQCGFATLSSFNRNFKEATSIAPHDWRKNEENTTTNPDKQAIMLLDGWL